MDPQHLGVVRGNSLEWEMNWSTGDGGDAVPWTDVADFNPTVQVRRITESQVEATPTVTIDGATTTFALTDVVVAGLTGDFVWDVRFEDPEAAEGMGVFTWPGEGEERCTLTVTPNVTAEVPA